MIADTTISGKELPEPTPKSQAQVPARTPFWQRLPLAGILLLSIFMNFYQLGQSGFPNLYYAAGIRSMLDNWHNFFFVSFDPGGFVTLDKPPLGFWLQTASAKIFGFSAFSVLFPEALSGVLAVLLLYWLVRRHFGVVAGLLAALALAISPISVLTSRNNTIDSSLVLTMLLGAWAAIRAAETGKLRWLLLCAVWIGLGFNIKMMEAYLVVPAFGLLYLLTAPGRIWVRLGHLALVTLLLLVLSLSWMIAVDLTPASQRPYVGSTQDNSELSLALGYNGIQRLLGLSGFGGGPPEGNRGADNARQESAANRENGTSNRGGFPQFENGAMPPFGGNGGPGNPGAGSQGEPFGGGGMFGTGNPGPLRLFNEPLGGQIVWLLPLALLGILALAWQGRGETSSLTYPENRYQLQSLIVWGTWLLTTAIFFSAAGFFHQYYLSSMAPAVCALFGIGVVVMWRDYLRIGWRGWLLPAAILLTALEQVHILTSEDGWGAWLPPVIAIACVLATVVLLIARLLPHLRINGHALPSRVHFNERVLFATTGVALATLLLVSAVWTATPVLSGNSQDLPAVGPTVGFGGGSARMGAPGGTRESNGRGGSEALPNISGSGQFGNGGPGGGVSTAMINYLKANQGNAKFLVAVASSNQADSIILETNLPVMAMGGFSGSDPILTTSKLEQLVADGTVRFFLSGGMGGGPEGGQGSATSWVTQNCKVVPSSQWQESSSSSNTNGDSQLYDCQGAASK